MLASMMNLNTQNNHVYAADVKIRQHFQGKNIDGIRINLKALVLISSMEVC